MHSHATPPGSGSAMTHQSTPSAEPLETPAPARPGRLPALGAPGEWRGIDFVTLAVVGIAFGVVMSGLALSGYWAWHLITSPFPPLQTLMLGLWLVPCLFGALLVRRPGAALLCLTLSASVQVVLGNPWGPGVMVSALLQGIGAELVFAAFRWRRHTLSVAALAGAVAVALDMIFLLHVFTANYHVAWKAAYAGFGIVSGAVLGGLAAWYLIRALAPTGALSAFPAGQEYLDQHYALRTPGECLGGHL